ncbi:precorrin-6y C5,15-methyltransferase (decarboxylating), CbiE subunit [Methanosalsum zhilinae DSM 4017]|uniref:Precorrin-6y C5,15-methyltransferase (Decarboxylating), CbiE subunit n=1 Tax=Methanosalsum zhilinae (strain DSM 4017 / NBRC 107636 / OCM 62 / WeN5) TaxID=679901 RepID=F7XKR1_METZD|nr:cobalt-precorrin-7 (C(5))-methyltransferase [Methanosalsum zhilinae]AEH61774.1 precorrin-6y C5,15-methyltransferase (decarboxylating), CbiE subunit [Methanosalsum zhilinae DSM 4017]
MIIVGVGVGPGMLTEEAIETIRNASVVYGSRRSIEMVSEYIQCESKQIRDYTKLNLLPDDAVVLSTGDPMFSGLGKFARKGDRIVPGISSLQITCARLGVNMDNDLAAITAHGRDPTPAKKSFIQELELGKTIFLLPADSFGTQEIAEILSDKLVNSKICICENLGYSNERIVCGTPSNPPEPESGLYCIMVIPE